MKTYFSELERLQQVDPEQDVIGQSLKHRRLAQAQHRTILRAGEFAGQQKEFVAQLREGQPLPGIGQTNLGYMYDMGLGRERDVATAAKWYRKAAEAGNPLGENNLADLYLRGEGVTQNDAEAFAWFQKAAEQGHTGARIKLGYLYVQGRGTAKDAQAGYAWIKAAEMAGDPRGNDMLRQLEKSLSQQQVAEAREQATRLQESLGALSAKSFAQ